MSARPLPLPNRVEDFNGQHWDSVAPYFEELKARPLTSDTVDAWLHDWSHLSKLLWDTYTTLQIAYGLDTASEQKQAAVEAFLADVYPQMIVEQQTLKQKLAETDFEAPEDYAVFLRSFRNEVEIYRDENVPLITEVQQLGLQYQKIMGAMTVEFDGEERTMQQLSPYLLKTDRNIREAAWRARRGRQMADREALHDLFDKMLALRHQIALNAGFENYRDYMFREMGRFDYTPEDCRSFHAAIEQVIVPAVAQRNAARREQMSLDVLRPWDTVVDPQGRQPLAPFKEVDTLIAKTSSIFEQIDSTLADQFKTMADENLLELDSRKGKAPGGYCAEFHMRARPFIYMNAVGIHGDVQTMIHESGHAFHAFETTRLPLIWQGNMTMEIAEVASMAMELLAAPHLNVFYDDVDTRRAHVELLEGTLTFLPYMAVVDSFQHWLYENPEHSHAERDAKWAELMRRFLPSVDWSGLENELESLWMRQIHIYEVPFYYVEYGIAQIGAWQVWRNSITDSAGALEKYRAALKLGYTRPLPELFSAAGAVFTAFTDTKLLGELVALIEDRLADLEGVA